MRKIICAVTVLILLLLCLTSCGITVPRPKIKEGEFNFSVTYELRGEIQTVSGVYVCEYNGTDWAIDGGYHRDWKGYVKDGEVEEIIVIATAENGGSVELFLHFNPEHFMGERCEDGEPFEPWISVRLDDEDGLRFENDADLIAEVYGARIISYEYDEPIKNTFG